MSCPYTKRAFDTGYKTDNGKKLLYITSNKTNFIYKPKSKECAYSQAPKDIFTDKIITDYVEIPCGECEQCQAKRAEEWKERCIAESKLWKHNCVINLTYNDENLPINHFKIIEETGERVKATPEESTIKIPTIRYKDVQDFKKRLAEHWKRKHGESEIRFVCACEYGDKRQRPHYHLIMFNLHLRDMEDHGFTPKGGREFLSKEIQKIWNKGWVTIGEVTEESIAYIANYTLKKIKGANAKEYYKQHGKEPEMIRYSNKPGIGATWFEAHKEEFYKYGKMYIGTNKGVLEIHSNRYLDRKTAQEDPELIEAIKLSRKELASRKEATRAKISGISIEEQRMNDARLFHERIKKAKIRSAIQ